jgi:hypothetical protein
MLGIETKEMWYSHIVKLESENEVITVVWDEGSETHREVRENRPSKMFKNNWDSTSCMQQ